MERIILVAHGSRKEGAVNLNALAESLHKMIHTKCDDNCIKTAYLQFNDPDLQHAIGECVREGADLIVIHPFFLGYGMHVTHDIPKIIQGAREKYPGVKILYTEPLGHHEYIIRTVWARIQEAKGPRGEDVERQSMGLIEQEVDLKGFLEDQVPIVRRVIHATADPEVGLSMVFHPESVKAGMEALKRGKGILTDVRMVLAGINQKRVEAMGGRVLCSMDFLEGSFDSNQGTRSEAAMERALRLNPDMGILAIGNAPTALLKALELIDSGIAHPDLVIGVPVGFVKAFEAKLALREGKLPFITNLSRKGGSPVAVAIVHALLNMVEGGANG